MSTIELNPLRYERELEIEKEVEKELERQVPSAKPRPEEDWEVSKLLTVQSIKDLGVKVFTLPKIFASTVPGLGLCGVALNSAK